MNFTSSGDYTKPEHPLISVINLEITSCIYFFFFFFFFFFCPPMKLGLVKDFYSIALKRNFNARIRYVRRAEYDF